MAKQKLDAVKPKPGMGAAYHIGSDVYPYTIVAVNKSGKSIGVIQTSPIIKKGMIVGYNEVDTGNSQRIFTLRKNGYFHERGRKKKSGYLTVGAHGYYMDPHF